jgi:hypothetical protein
MTCVVRFLKGQLLLTATQSFSFGEGILQLYVGFFVCCFLAIDPGWIDVSNLSVEKIYCAICWLGGIFTQREDNGVDEDFGLIKRAILSLRKRFRISPSI